MKYQIEPIHLGRYWFTVLDDNNQIISKSYGGSAFIMLMLTETIFKPEHRRYMEEQRADSDRLAEETICALKRSQPKLLK